MTGLPELDEAPNHTHRGWFKREENELSTFLPWPLQKGWRIVASSCWRWRAYVFWSYFFSLQVEWGYKTHLEILKKLPLAAMNLCMPVTADHSIWNEVIKDEYNSLLKNQTWSQAQKSQKPTAGTEWVTKTNREEIPEIPITCFWQMGKSKGEEST